MEEIHFELINFSAQFQYFFFIKNRDYILFSLLHHTQALFSKQVQWNFAFSTGTAHNLGFNVSRWHFMIPILNKICNIRVYSLLD
jgi:hypothetical protein